MRTCRKVPSEPLNGPLDDVPANQFRLVAQQSNEYISHTIPQYPHITLTLITLNMPTPKPKAVPFEWLEQHILPKLDDALRLDLEATLDELKQLPTSVSYIMGFDHYHT